MKHDEVEAVVQEHSTRIAGLVPDAEVHLTGSASVPGLDPDDVDLVALVTDVQKAAELLRTTYPPLYEEQWSDEWAAFRSGHSPQVDLVLTTRGSVWDAHHRLAWHLLRHDEALRLEYAALKREPQRNAERKREFFERVVRLLPDAAESSWA